MLSSDFFMMRTFEKLHGKSLYKKDGIEKMDFISNVVDFVNKVLWDYALLFLLVGTGVFYT